MISSLANDVQSYHGSLAGTLASSHSRGTLRDVDRLAKRLREYHADEQEASSEFQKRAPVKPVPRFNKSFHHFRIFVVLMSGLAAGLMLSSRYAMTVSILKMVNQTHMYLEENPNRTVDDFLAEGYSLGGDFNWNNEIISIILSWYFITYTAFQLPATQLALKVGCQWSITISLLIVATSMLLTPWLGYFGWQYVVAMRLLNGLGASAVNAITFNIVEIWMRGDETSLGMSLNLSVVAILVTFTPLFTGYLADIHWEYSFYVPGIVTIVFCLVWFLFIANEPQSSKLVSEKELRYLLEDVENKTIDKEPPCADDTRKVDDGLATKPDSWLQLFQVPSYYAHILSWIIYNCVNLGLFFILPLYLRQFLKTNVADSGFYVFLIQTAGILPVIWPHAIESSLLKRGYSMTNIRRISQTISCVSTALILFYVGLFHDNQIIMFFLARAFISANDVLFPSALMSNFGKAGLTSVTYSIANSISDILVVPSSTFIGWILDYTGQSREGWTWIFMALGVAELVMLLVFVVCTDAKPIRFKNTKRNVDIEKLGAGEKGYKEPAIGG